jgi:hypothetical protein
MQLFCPFLSRMQGKYVVGTGAQLICIFFYSACSRSSFLVETLLIKLKVDRQNLGVKNV